MLRFWSCLVLLVCGVIEYFAWNTPATSPAVYLSSIVCLPIVCVAIFALLPSRLSGF